MEFSCVQFGNEAHRRHGNETGSETLIFLGWHSYNIASSEYNKWLRSSQTILPHFLSLGIFNYPTCIFVWNMYFVNTSPPLLSRSRLFCSVSFEVFVLVIFWSYYNDTRGNDEINFVKNSLPVCGKCMERHNVTHTTDCTWSRISFVGCIKCHTLWKHKSDFENCKPSKMETHALCSCFSFFKKKINYRRFYIITAGMKLATKEITGKQASQSCFFTVVGKGSFFGKS